MPRTRPIPCVNCGMVNDHHTGVLTDRSPSPGDLALCARCGRMGIFEDTPFGLTQRPPTEEELRKLGEDPHISKILTAWAMVRAHMNRN